MTALRSEYDLSMEIYCIGQAKTNKGVGMICTAVMCTVLTSRILRTFILQGGLPGSNPKEFIDS
ncbi:hypothetical protein NECAME_12735 [Necator americanus]|uniref:Uncharacterized protein n=1 Tax=Necator americanus TaxID=51031 RepID=W2SYB8_NECAM|nr:hypothetical protein NECAME_12735 [Necator americanus]ETN74749.1 hypothetical protein NECAME_12735 [Necator americanus]